MDFSSDHLATETEEPTQAVEEQQADGAVTETQAEDDGALPSLDELPDDVRSIVEKFQKSFQGDYTRKRKEESEALAKAQEKAAALDRLISDPDYAARFMAAMQAGKQPAQTNVEEQPWMKADPAAYFNDENVTHIKAASFQVVREVMAPVFQELEQYKKLINEQFLPVIKEFQEQKVSGAWKALETKYANANQYKEAADKLRQTAPHLSHEQALYAVAGPNLKALGPTGQRPAENKRQGQLFNGSTSGNNRSGGKVDLTDLITQARRNGGG